MTSGKLYHATSSYYSMLVRLVQQDLKIEGIEKISLDVRDKKEHFAPDFLQKNPLMTVPVLETGDAFLTESRDIIEHFVKGSEQNLVSEDLLKEWLDLHYAQGIEFYTVAHLCHRFPLYQYPFRYMMEKAVQKLDEERAQHPEFTEEYSRKIALVRWRQYHLFDGKSYEQSKEYIETVLKKMKEALSDGRSFILGDEYSVLDSLNTVFLARIAMVQRNAVTDADIRRYWKKLKRRDNFKTAEITYKHPVEGVWSLWERAPERISL